MCERGKSVQVSIAGRVRDIDACIAPLVVALNAIGYTTVASCCGHGLRPGNVSLKDGREIVVARCYEEGRLIDALFSPLA